MYVENRRQSPRVKYDGVGCIYIRRGKWVSKMPYICHIKDISAKGVCFETDRVFDTGEGFTLTVHRPQLEEELVLYGDIVWRQDKPSGMKQYGARLYSTDFEESFELGEDVERLAGRQS